MTMQVQKDRPALRHGSKMGGSSHVLPRFYDQNSSTSAMQTKRTAPLLMLSQTTAKSASYAANHKMSQSTSSLPPIEMSGVAQTKVAVSRVLKHRSPRQKQLQQQQQHQQLQQQLNSQRIPHRSSSKLLHRYTSLPSRPTKEMEYSEIDDMALEVCGQSLNSSKFQKLLQQSPRNNHSRFELIEDRFLASNPSSVVQTPRARLSFPIQPVPKVNPFKETFVVDSSSTNSVENEHPVQFFKYMEPRVRFRRAVRLIILLLRAIYTTRERTRRQEKERKLSLCLNISNPNNMISKRAYETYGLSFDPQDFKANRQIQITNEARTILTMDPCQRTNQQLHAVLVSLRQAVPEFSEFPINMQQSLAKVGRYERFTAKRVIIRQGHLADNFYFILSGTAVVIILETDKMTGEQKTRTAAVLGRGKSFGELALMHKARRSATVTCRDDVELLSVGREDFVDIFMHVDRGVEPEHIRFMRSLTMFRGWPLHLLPYDNPKILLFTYVRRGVVLCRDSNTSEWIFIIKSGSCRIIKALPALPTATAKKSTRPRPMSKSKDTSPIPAAFASKSLTRIEEEAATSDEDQSSFLSDELDILELGLANRKKERISSSHDKNERDEKKLGLQYIQSLDAITEHKPSSSLNEHNEKYLQEELNTEDSTQPCIFVQVLKLGPKDIYSPNKSKSDIFKLAKQVWKNPSRNLNNQLFGRKLSSYPVLRKGLESSIFSTMKKTVSTSLVSDGAEMIMINRKFFMDNTSSEIRKRMRKEIHPLPTEESLQNQLQSRVEWETYRTLTLQKTMADMNLIDTHRR